MILKHDLTFLVNDSDVRNTSETPVLELILISPVHFGLVPSLFSTTCFDSLSVLVQRYSHDSHTFPCVVGSVLSQHFLVVGHGSLARGAPSCPEVDEPYLPFLVLEFVDGGVVRAFDEVFEFEIFVVASYCCGHLSFRF